MMRRPVARLAGACALAVAMLTLTGSAVADGGGDHGYGGDHGSKSQPQQTQQQTQGSDSHGGWKQQDQASQQSQQSQDQQQAGVKPSSHTDHWTHTSVGASPDVSKRYGNGQTAAEIAKSRGAPDNQPLTGPGNSQPHKTFDCRHKDNHSGGVDVHAIKSYSGNGCTVSTTQPVEQKQPEQQPQQPEVQKPEVQKPEEQKVTICHATGSATNPYVEITVDEHALKNGHTAEKGDIIPAPAGGCPAVAAPQVQGETETCVAGQSMSSDEKQGESSDEQGTSEDHAQSESGDHGTNDQGEASECTVSGQAPVVVTPQATPPATPQTQAPAQQVAPTQQVAPPQASAAAPATQSPSSSGVLGAQTTLATPKHHRGGVLGTVANIAGSSLPFTGFPVWLAVLIAAMLILAGIALRRRSLGGGRL